MSNLQNLARKGFVALATLGASVAAFAQTTPAALPDASAQIEAITTAQGGYATVMFALALTAVGILVGVKWIKRGRGAA